MIRAEDGGDSVRAVALGAMKFFDVVNSGHGGLIFQPTIDSWEGRLTFVPVKESHPPHQKFRWREFYADI